ncbi:MAG: DNA recombination protein RmuC [Deltaproteobacteria bacterium]|nr:DNA recombination protein RmuC [Deltaproteobacteria bacterium]
MEIITIFFQLVSLGLIVSLILLLKKGLNSQMDFPGLKSEFASLRQESMNMGKMLREESMNMGKILREETMNTGRALREEIQVGLNTHSSSFTAIMSSISENQIIQWQGMIEQLNVFDHQTQGSLDRIRIALDSRLNTIQSVNEKKLDEMRNLVDEKLQTTLEKRIGESFRQVSERLESVYRGLGEMQNLAAGVGDLKRVLTNVKSRGSWGEIQLGAILDDILTPEQYAKNVKVVPDKNTIVEFAVRLPGNGNIDQLWLPIDSKFPQEDYLRLLDASEKLDTTGIDSALKGLISAVRKSAQDIHSKYISPPYTTDFAIMFLPTEGLFSEVLRQPGLSEVLQSQYKVIVAGPTTISAVLTSLRLGFHTLAIEKHTSEVWTILGAVKTEFKKYDGLMTKIRNNLNSALKNIDATETRNRQMLKQLKNVEALSEEESLFLMGGKENDDDE